MKTALPWLLALIFAGGAYFLYAENQKKTADITRLMEEARAAQTLRAENESLKAAATQTIDSTQTEKEHADLLRLRSEMQTLHDQSKNLNAQLHTAQAQNAQAQETRQQLSQVVAENQALRVQAGSLANEDPTLSASRARNECINNLRQIDGAKQQWALEKRKLPSDIPTADDITPYLTGGKLPACPSHGAYVIGDLKTTPICSIPGHLLQ